MRLTLVLTHRCNLGCDYCFAGRKFNRSMPDELAMRAIRMAFRTPPEEPVGLSFFGGEPMLEFPLLARLTRQAVRLAQRSGRRLEFSITTNGTLLSPRHLHFLRHYGFYVALSIDGVGAVQDRHRTFVGGRNSSEVVWRNLARAVERLERLHVMSVVNPDTLDGLLELAEKLYRLGVGSMSLLPNHEAFWSDAERARVREVYHRLARISFATLETDERFAITPFAQMHPVRPLRVPACGFGEGECTVSPRGHLYPCAKLVGTDTHEAVRIGSLDQGLDRDRVGQLSACRQGRECHCLELMPGPRQRALENKRFFRLLANEAADAAWRWVQNARNTLAV